MSNKTIYSCDLCSAELKNEELNKITVTVKPKGIDYSWDHKHLDACADCMKEKLKWVLSKKNNDPEAVEPSIEDLLRTIVQRCSN